MASMLQAPTERLDELWAQAVEALENHTAAELSAPAFQRDPEFIERYLPVVGDVIDRYFAPEVRGVDRLPDDGPFLLVSNHSGGFLMPDVWALAAEMLDSFGIDRVIHPLVFDFAFAIPGFGPALRRLGGVPANMDNAKQALSDGAGVLVYPGGDWEAYRPWPDRNRIDFKDHTGFIRLAMREGVPVYPAVTHGSHDTLVVVSRGEEISRALGLDKLRVQVFPFTLGVPFGVVPVFLPNLPNPAKILIEVLEPLSWTHHGPAAADDEDVVRAAYAEVTGRMQQTLDRLVAEMPHPVATRVVDMAGTALGGVSSAVGNAAGTALAPVRGAARRLLRPFG